jgi:flagellar hook-associated protein FlgK
MVGLNTPLEGLARAQTDFDQAAAKVADSFSVDAASQDQVSLSDAAVAMMQAGNDYQANLKSLQVVNDMQKSILNILA